MMDEEKLQANTPTSPEAGATQPAAQPAATPPPEAAAAETAPAAVPAEEAAAPEAAPEASAETDAPAQPPEPPAPKPESKARRFFRRLFRWTLGVLVVFGLGFVTAAWLLYLPVRDKAASAEAAAAQAAQQAEETQGQLLDAQAQVKDLQQQLQAAQDDLQTAQLREALAEAFADAYAVRLALKDDDATGARLQAEALVKALARLQALVPAEHQEIVADLQAQAADVQENLDSPNYADRQVRGIIQHLMALEDLLAGE